MAKTVRLEKHFDGRRPLLPILIYCVDKKGRPVLGKPRPGPETAHFIEHEAYKDIALVILIPALRELHYVTRYDDPK
ncbi:hypothetical protein [Mesorhizobium sp.]|uniref:hypothetical protein n=1 Tax=Mesorhizobium sp. TaxID=1871066 RepID=UPI0025BDF830|nr:hypothetical protein [Mesorhizobium sp.]